MLRAGPGWISETASSDPQGRVADRASATRSPSRAGSSAPRRFRRPMASSRLEPRAFKAQYLAANLIGLTLAIGPGVPAVASFVDDVSVTIAGATDAWDFEPAAAAPTP